MVSRVWLVGVKWQCVPNFKVPVPNKRDSSLIYMAPQNKVNLFYPKKRFYKYILWLLSGDFPGLCFMQQHNLVDWLFHSRQRFVSPATLI